MSVGQEIMVKICLIVGTRPQIIKSSPLIHELSNNSNVSLKIIHTGQHFDYEMSKVFFEKLSIPDPYANLNVGSGSHGYQIAAIIQKLEKVLIDLKTDIVLIPGDTNSALASALTSIKVGVCLAHLESGARCYDMLMAEEVNRRIIDHISSILFAVSENCISNLEKESVLGKLFLFGDTMYDVFVQEQPRIEKSKILDKLDISDYCALTLHRAENVDDVNKLKSIIGTITKAINKKIVFPIHPRTKRIIDKSGIDLGNIVTIEPLPYHDLMKLINNSFFVLTDSGGLQKEAFWSKSPCITLREKTEWVETRDLGVNFIAGTSNNTITLAIDLLLKNYDQVKERFRSITNPYGDGLASRKICKVLVGEA